MTEEKKKEFTLRIAGANKSELVVILYEMTLQYLEEMREAIENSEYTAVSRSAQRARNCLSELENSLNSDFEISANLMSIYTFAENRISRAQGSLDSAMVENVINLISQLYDSWVKVADEDDSEPVMMNTEQVYMGLTYDRFASGRNGRLDVRSRGYYA